MIVEARLVGGSAYAADRTVYLRPVHGDYYTLPAGHRLQPLVHSIWQVHTDAPQWNQRVLPRGVVDLLFPLEGKLTITDAAGRSRPSVHRSPFLVGIQSRAVSSQARDPIVLLGLSLRSRAICSIAFSTRRRSPSAARFSSRGSSSASTFRSGSSACSTRARCCGARTIRTSSIGRH